MEKIAIVFCSQRKNGTNTHIREYIDKKGVEVNYITLYDKVINPCCHCMRCRVAGKCSKYKDDFYDIIHSLEEATAIIFISPLYTFVPSRITAFLERLSNVEYFTECNSVMEGKKIGIVGYDSNGISYRLIKLLKEIMLPIINNFDDLKEYRFLIDEKQKQHGYIDVGDMLDDIFLEI